MGLFNWIFGKHPPRPVDPQRSVSAGLVPSWQAELLVERLMAGGIETAVSEDHASYMVTGSSEAMVNLFVMEPDFVAASQIVEQFGLEPGPTFLIRPAEPQDEAFLRDMLYQALFVPNGTAPFPPDVVDELQLARYIRGFGSLDKDSGWIAESPDREPLGAVWVRLFNATQPGYGFVDASTPELSIAVVPSRRGEGIGSSLLLAMLESVPRVSLSVDCRSRAVSLYQRFGFRTVTTDGNTDIMLIDGGS